MKITPEGQRKKTQIKHEIKIIFSTNYYLLLYMIVWIWLNAIYELIEICLFQDWTELNWI